MSANLFKRGAVWHYRFQVAGERAQRSTKLRNRAKAEAFAQAAYDDAVLRAHGGEPVPTLAKLGQAWLEIHRPVVSFAHFRSVETFLRLHTYDLGSVRVDDITTETVELARNKHLADHAPASANHWLRIVKLLTLWAVKRGMLAKSPWKVAMIKVQKKPRSILPTDVASAWFAAVDAATVRSPGAATAIRLMFGLGLREREAAGARWEWIDWQRATYTPGKTKGREAVPLPMPEWLVEHLAPMRKAAGLIAPRKNGSAHPEGFARSPMQVANAVCATKGITPHRLRGTFATLLSEEGVPIQSIQEIMRHKNHSTTMAYLEKNMGLAVKAQQQIGRNIGFERRESGAQEVATPSSTNE